MKESDRKQLLALLQNVDEAFLVALANKGLVRRALKGLETAALQVEEADDCLVVRAADWSVRMPPGGPAHARDDTRATGVTWQILAATVFLRDNWAKTGQAAQLPSPLPAAGLLDGKAARVCETPEHPQLDALLEIGTAELYKWAGKKLLAEAAVLSNEPFEMEMDYSRGLTIRLPGHDLELRLLPTGDRGLKLLEHIFSTAPKALHKRWVVTLLLALQRRHGKVLQLPQSSLPESAGAPRNRLQVVQETKQLLESMVSTGVAHPSQRIVERLFTLSISASAVHLPRLSHLLRSLASEVSLLIKRDASADTARLFSSMSWTFSLAQAIEAAGEQVSFELAGQARTQYDSAGDLQLASIAAYPWHTASGFEGLTVLFWEKNSRRILSWSTSRPDSGAGRIDVAKAYESSTIWTGGGSCRQLSRSFFTLRDSRVNASGRLSSTQQSTVESLLAQGDGFDCGERLFADWSALQEYAAKQFPVGLGLANPLDRIVFLQPQTWGDRYFDEMQQALCWKIADQSAQTLTLIVPWNRTNARTVEFLEALKPAKERIKLVVARIAFFGLAFALEPLSFVRSDPLNGDHILNPAFDHALIESKQSVLLAHLRKKFGFDRIATSMSTDDEWETSLQSESLQQAVPAPIRNVLVQTEALLLELAESGVKQLSESRSRQFKDTGARLSHCGLAALGESLESIESGSSIAGSLLRSDYLCQLYWQSVTQSFRF